VKVTFVLRNADELGGTELATFTLAAQLADHYEVEVLSVFRTRDEPFFPIGSRIRVDYLVDSRGPAPRPLWTGEFDDIAAALGAVPSELVREEWEYGWSRLSDLAFEAALPGRGSDVVISTSPPIMALIARHAAPRAVTLHAEHRPSQLRGPTGMPLLRYASRLDGLVSLTDRTKDWFAESLGEAAPALAAIPNAAPEGFVPQSGLDTKTIVTARRLVPDKRVADVIEAFALLREDFPDWRLRILGDGPERRKLGRLVTERGLESSVELLGATRDMAAQWARASLNVLTSEHGEAFPLVLLEAAAAGVPSVSYDILTGPAEIIRHDVDGLLVAKGEIEALAAAMADLMGDPERLAAFGAAAKAGLDRFSAETVTRQWRDLLEPLAAEADSPERFARRQRRMAAQARDSGLVFSRAAPANLGTLGAVDRDLEAALQQRRADLVRVDGTLMRIEDVMPETLTGRVVSWVDRTLREAGVPFVALRHDGTHARLAVDRRLRRRAIEAVAAAAAGEPVYAEVFSTAARERDGILLARQLHGDEQLAAVRVFTPTATSSGTVRFGASFGCDIEFWPESQDGPGFTTPRQPTAYGRLLPGLEPDAAMDLFGVRVPTLAMFNRRLADDVDVPVDVVYTWVDGADPAWRERRDRYATGSTDQVDGAETRYRSRDELRYSLRSLEMFLPWVRHVHLVTDGQVPDWLDTSAGGLTVVDHRELFKDPSVLPVFNSHAIETQLHRVPGLSEHFLYFNDDVFIGKRLSAKRFFDEAGRTRFFPSPTRVPFPGEEPEDPYFGASRNNQRLLAERFGITVTHGFLHTPHALRRSVLEALAEEFPAEFAKTMGSRFRSMEDLSVAASLAHHYGRARGYAVASTMGCEYINSAESSHHQLLTRLLQLRHRDAFCIADGEGDVPPAEQQRVVRTFLEAYFPIPSRWERPA
jgi:glycosyltransferase involved in cell wall biosynthesis